jgi:hypothetical protein
MKVKVKKSNHKTQKGWFWCSERKDFFRWDDLMNYYKLCNLIESTNKSKGLL